MIVLLRMLSRNCAGDEVRLAEAEADPVSKMARFGVRQLMRDFIYYFTFLGAGTALTYLVYLDVQAPI